MSRSRISPRHAHVRILPQRPTHRSANVAVGADSRGVIIDLWCVVVSTRSGLDSDDVPVRLAVLIQSCTIVASVVGLHERWDRTCDQYQSGAAARSSWTDSGQTICSNAGQLLTGLAMKAGPPFCVRRLGYFYLKRHARWA